MDNLPTSQSNKKMFPPAFGEKITCDASGNTYTIGNPIGEGNFGIVYECQDVWGNDLAAKVLKPTRPYEKVKETATNEFIKLKALRNPHITFVIDAFEYKNTFYIITERCLDTIAALFEMKDFTGPVWIIPIARSLLQALHYIHIHNFTHQDIHAGNVFTTFLKDALAPTNNRVLQFKLGDLGIAKLFNEINEYNTRAQWMLPPEVLNPQEFGPIDHRIDIYHAGLLFLELAYSKRLYFSQDDVLKGKPRQMAEVLNAPYSQAIAKALRRHSLCRQATAMEFWLELQLPQI